MLWNRMNIMKMKRNWLFVFSVGFAAIATSMFIANEFNGDIDSKYTQSRDGLATKQDANDFKEWQTLH